MIIAVSCVSILAFVIVFWKAGVVPAAKRAMVTAASASSVISSKELSDAEKEKLVQKAAIGMLGSVFSILLRSAIALIAAAIPIFAAAALDLVSANAVIQFLSRWDVIIVVSIVMVIGYIVGSRLWQTK